jgi:hypothetical protein
MSSKTKLTLSVNRYVIKEAKKEFLLRDASMSQMVEDFLKTYSNSWINEMMSTLKIENKYVSYESVIKNRSKGANSESAVRGFRNDRSKNLFR